MGHHLHCDQSDQFQELPMDLGNRQMSRMEMEMEME